MMIFRQEIDHLNGHIATLLSTICSLCRAISSLQDATFGAKNDELDLVLRGEQETDGTAEIAMATPMPRMIVPMLRMMLPTELTLGMEAMVEMKSVTMHLKSSTALTATKWWWTNRKEQ
ncbi:hypothetical protein RHGRI_007644 [Rhododendron griersonianum]|nr:hypothetical protein RHGRI_007644 [Rhododendron griersonianum]